MKLLRNRIFAIAIAIVIAALATLFGVYRTSSQRTKEIEAMFYDGVYLDDGGYTLPSMASHLSNSADAALGLATMMGNRPELADETEGLIDARRELLDAGSISDICPAYSALVGRFYALWFAAMDIDLTGREVEAAQQFHALLQGAQAAMGQSRYNEKVAEYLDGQSNIVQLMGAFMPLKAPFPFDFPDLPI